jgi:beta,beta-carotene 9',10'-dioxygenase
MLMGDFFSLGFGKTEAELDLPSLPVRGLLPDWLHGTLLRNGPGTFEIGGQHYRHWFDGLAMLHRFSFQNGNVSYANKFLRSSSYAEAKARGRIAFSEFATDPCRGLFGRAMAVFHPGITDSAKVSIAKLAGQVMALAETPIQVAFDPQTLETAGVFQYEEKRVGQMTTVHPHIDEARHEAYNVVTRYHAISHYNVHRISNTGQKVRIGSVPVTQPAYMHSFGMTQNYFILAEFPLVVNPIHLLLWLKPYIENFHWQPKRGTRIWLVHRGSGEVAAQYETEAFFAFHHVNAFEQGDEVVMDIAAYDDAAIIQSYYLDKIKDTGSELPFGNLRRYRLPLKAGRRGVKVTYETISPVCMELPHFDYAHYNLRADYRYVYAISVDEKRRQGFYNQLVKVDIQTRGTKTWMQEDCYPGEAVFVPAPGRKAEDDGVILSVVLDAKRGTSFLLVLNAATFEEIARAEIPQPVLIGYHGMYLDEREKI